MIGRSLRRLGVLVAELFLALLGVLGAIAMGAGWFPVALAIALVVGSVAWRRDSVLRPTSFWHHS
jgi:hypothetical protein